MAEDENQPNTSVPDEPVMENISEPTEDLPVSEPEPLVTKETQPEEVKTPESEPVVPDSNQPTEIITDPNNPNVTITKTPDTVTITEVMEPVRQTQGEQPKTEPEKPRQDIVRELLTKARAKKQEKKRAKIDKLFQEITEKGKITNDEVEKFLHVSDPTATRYLDILEKEGKIRQVGKTGKYTHYEKI